MGTPQIAALLPGTCPEALFHVHRMCGRRNIPRGKFGIYYMVKCIKTVEKHNMLHYTAFWNKTSNTTRHPYVYRLGLCKSTMYFFHFAHTQCTWKAREEISRRVVGSQETGGMASCFQKVEGVASWPTWGHVCVGTCMCLLVLIFSNLVLCPWDILRCIALENFCIIHISC